MKRHRQPLPLVAFLVFLLAACASTAPPASTPPAATAAPTTAATAAPAASAAAQLADDVRWVRDSAEYRALAAQAYALANRRLDELVAGRQPGTWAVALDVDETVL